MNITSCSSSLQAFGPPRDTQSYVPFWGGFATIPKNYTPALVPLSKALYVKESHASSVDNNLSAFVRLR